MQGGLQRIKSKNAYIHSTVVSNIKSSAVMTNLRTKIIPLLTVFLLFFMGSTFALAFYTVNHGSGATTANKYLDPSLSLIERDHMIVGFKDLRVKLEDIVTSHEEANISIYFEFLNSGANIQTNKNFRIIPASLTKVPTAIVILKKIESDKMSFDDTLELTDDVLDTNSGTLFQEKVGTDFTIKFLLEKSITESDNTANKILYNQITPQDVLDLREELGLEELFDNEGRISAKEYSRVIRSLYTSSYLSPENSEYLLSLMVEAKEKRYLSSGLPENISFAHKYGADITDGVFNDSGIVYLENRPYLLTVMIEGNKEDEILQKDAAAAIMKEISETVFSEVVKQ